MYDFLVHYTMYDEQDHMVVTLEEYIDYSDVEELCYAYISEYFEIDEQDINITEIFNIREDADVENILECSCE